ncbi:hypothetical protein V497_00300 [Pseudogymnoascus sp. VKM F-4516 (FW-969)]|nr:hypothetical protein V497_00300 [Pseudogymnoascus sp. VKM F-4516 (FW-969)]
MSTTCIKKTCLLAFLLFNLSVPAVALPAISLRQAAPGTQFITGACTTDADCASACCGFKSGKCAGPIVAQERDGGCGFGDAQPNDTAAVALTGGASVNNGNAATGQAAAADAAAGTSAAPAAGSQFITGACTSDADCASACCGFNSGKCAGPVVAQERDGGCGFGDAQPNDTAAQALTGGASANVNSSAGQAASAGTSAVAAPGSQFITGACTSDADCASACCGFNSGKCAGPVVAQERDGGCGFGDAQPNDTAAQALTGGASANVNSSAGQAASAGTSAVAAPGSQFITGACTSDADCASACCGFNSGKCAGPVVAQERDGGCGFGDAQPNDTAAQALTGGASANVNSAAGQAAPAGTSAAPAAGSQFITGACTSDADCASACCGFNSGKCAGPVVAQERDGGCGFGDAQPNDTAAKALTGQ